MIKITIDGPACSGKTLISMRIAKMLQEEGVDVSVITETIPHEVLTKFYGSPINEITPKLIECEINDTNGQTYDPKYHETCGFKGIR